MSIIQQVKDANGGRLPTEEDLEKTWKRIGVNPKTVKKITLNEELLGDVKLRFYSGKLRIGKGK